MAVLEQNRAMLNDATLSDPDSTQRVLSGEMRESLTDLVRVWSNLPRLKPAPLTRAERPI